jgi:hypothetical protein
VERANEPTRPMAVYCERSGAGNRGDVNVACSSAKVDGGRLKKHAANANEGFVGMIVTDTALFRNEAYHTQDDTPDRQDEKRMAEVVVSVATTVRSEATR